MGVVAVDAAVDGITHGKEHGAVAVVGAASAVLEGRAAELRDGEDQYAIGQAVGGEIRVEGADGVARLPEQVVVVAAVVLLAVSVEAADAHAEAHAQVAVDDAGALLEVPGQRESG